MKAIPQSILNLQSRASDPDSSAFVTANAGSGKTYVLAQRVIRLLLRGCPPSRILCITFTKAAAANMANQVFKTLSEWTSLDDPQLDAAIAAIEGSAPTLDMRARARRLFAQALDTPGGLKVQTIHAFCTRILHQFPFEANVAADFSVLEERAEIELLESLRASVLREAASNAEGELGRALEYIIKVSTDDAFIRALHEAIGKRGALIRWFERAKLFHRMSDDLSRALRLDPATSLTDVEKALVVSPLIAQSEWTEVAAFLAAKSKTDQDQATRFQALCEQDPAEQIATLYKVFCSEKAGERRKRVITKSLAATNPNLAARLEREQHRFCELFEQYRAVRARDRTLALLTLAKTVLERYHREKVSRGFLDYDDLIETTLDLLTRTAPAWVLYKLDLGIDHILIDEAQDTSPKQWEIVRALTAELLAGAGARSNVKRTIFAVGDEKQSIYSFQGAEPRHFETIRSHYAREHRDSGLPFAPIQFQHSFRSGPNVLSAVDAVFRDIAGSISSDAAGVPLHESLPEASPGLVELWDFIGKEESTKKDPWNNPFDADREHSPASRLANTIATRAKHWIQSGQTAPKDILILVRQRGPLFSAIIRALKVAEIPVAGADRLVLTEHIAIMDLIALADCLLYPADDLALVIVLKSPLFGLNDDDLFDLAWSREGTLLQSLRLKAAAKARYADALALWRRLREAAMSQTPFLFYAGVLGAEQGRAKILKRLGGEAADALDEFLHLALEYERRHTPSLQGFVAAIRASAAQVKRDMEFSRDEIRVMTVHGAKGLEAQTVILADTTARPVGPRDPLLLECADETAPGAPTIFVWCGPKTNDCIAMKAARENSQTKTKDEYRRLLYVAMTRAKERLIVCGASGATPPEGCWYELVQTALRDEAIEEPADDGDGVVYRWRKHGSAAPSAQNSPIAAQSQIVLPLWLTESFVSAVNKTHRLRPSRVMNSEPPTNAGAREAALTRGILVHRLLQSLPMIETTQRRGAAMRVAARNPHMTIAEREALVEKVLRILSDPGFSPLFTEHSFAEAPIIGRLRQNDRIIEVSGQIDRLAVTDQGVLIADYKTTRPAPLRLEDAPDEATAQLALYRAVLQGLYADREIRCAIVWTDIPSLMAIPAEFLDARLMQL